MPRDVIVIGAGLAGSSIATALAAAGWDVLLVERDTFPRHKVCGEFISPEAQSSFRVLGLYDTVSNLSPVHINRARLVARGGLDLSVPLPGDAWGVSRFALDAALAAAAADAGAELRTGTTITRLESSPDGFQVELRDAEGRSSVEARAAIVACGRNPVAALRPAADAGRPIGRYVGVKAHYDGVAMPAQVELFLFDGGYAGLSLVEGGRANLCMLLDRDTFARSGGSVSAALAAAARWNPALGQRLIGAELLPETECAVAPVDTERPSSPWDTAPRLGDAATMIPPLCGDGMAMALRAAEVCAPLTSDFLHGRHSLESWRHAYQLAWHHEFSRRLRAGRQLQKLLSLPGLSGAAVGLGRLLPGLAMRVVHATRGAS